MPRADEDVQRAVKFVVPLPVGRGPALHPKAPAEKVNAEAQVVLKREKVPLNSCGIPVAALQFLPVPPLPVGFWPTQGKQNASNTLNTVKRIVPSHGRRCGSRKRDDRSGQIVIHALNE